MRVLIADDSLTMRKQIKKILEDMGHEVVAEAKNAEEAISEYAHFKAELATMDITMSGNDGIYATKAILLKNEYAKIIMVTSHGQEEMVVAAIRAGALGYVLKPVTKEKIEAEIKKIFNQ